MRTTYAILILTLLIIHSRASLFRDGVIDGCKKCCADAYGDNEDSKGKCLTTLQNGYVDSYIQKDIESYVVNYERLEKVKVLENDPEYKDILQSLSGELKKNKIDSLLESPEVQAKVKPNADAYVQQEVTTIKEKLDEICKYEKTISNGLTPDLYGFIIASAIGQYGTEDARKFTEYLKAQSGEKLKKIIDLKPTYWQLLYRHAPNMFEKLNDYADVFLTDEFKSFYEKYDKWYPTQQECCKIEEIVPIYDKYKNKITTENEESYKNEMQEDINKCAKVAKDAAVAAAAAAAAQVVQK